MNATEPELQDVCSYHARPLRAHTTGVDLDALQVLIIYILYNSKQRMHVRIKACAIRFFERLEVVETAITQLS